MDDKLKQLRDELHAIERMEISEKSLPYAAWDEARLIHLSDLKQSLLRRIIEIEEPHEEKELDAA